MTHSLFMYLLLLRPMKISSVINVYIILLQMRSLKLFHNSNFSFTQTELVIVIPNYGDLTVLAEC